MATVPHFMLATLLIARAVAFSVPPQRVMVNSLNTSKQEGNSVHEAPEYVVATQIDSHMQRTAIVGSWHQNAPSFGEGVSYAAVAKMIASVDDVVFLLPFIINGNTWQMIIGYEMCMQLVVAVSIALAFGADSLVSKLVSGTGFWNSRRVIDAASSCILLGFCCKLIYEDYFADSDDDEIESSCGAAEKGEASAETTPNEEAATETKNAKARANTTASKYVLSRLVIVSLCGSSDDVSIFTPMLASKLTSGYEVAIGVCISSTLVLLICSFSSQLGFVRDAVAKVPLSVIIGILFIMSTVKMICDGAEDSVASRSAALISLVFSTS
jgi:cadmium resistance protein CadD (predicted permease)